MPHAPDADLAIAGFTLDRFTHDGTTRPVHRAGEGPGVLFMHEVPGITPPNIAFARRLVDAGFTVAMPDLLGDAGRPISIGYTLASATRLCLARDFQAFATKADRPVVRWLRALGVDLHRRAGGPGIGAVGMCMTGGFALGLAIDPHVLAPVLSQPSLPVPLTPSRARDIGITDADAATVAARCDTEGLCILGLRFSGDPLVPDARFAALQARFGDAFEAVTLDAARWRDARDALPAGERPLTIGGRPHSVLGGDYIDAPPTRDALDRVLQLFTDRLQR